MHYFRLEATIIFLEKDALSSRVLMDVMYRRPIFLYAVQKGSPENVFGGAFCFENIKIKLGETKVIQFSIVYSLKTLQ
jgi:hypothetical protein